MPLEAKACLRCSYLEAASLAPAPFADLYCHGKDVIDTGNRQVQAFRFEQTVFGEPVAQYWIDAERNIVQTMYGPTIRGVPVSQNDVLHAFPTASEGFPPIEILPPLQRLQAN
jgi:hypothetical protein